MCRMSDTAQAPAASAPSLAEWLTPFEPAPYLRGGHAQTLAGNYWSRPPLTIPVQNETVQVDPADGSRVLCHVHWQPENLRASRLTILLVHGLEGSSDSRYMQGIAARAWAEGCNIIRMNMRNCGGTESWTPTLYHSGLSGDVEAVARHFVAQQGLERVGLVGYSMGGNLVLKLAGELAHSRPEWLRAVVGICPASDLAATADALHEPANRVYEWHFLRNLMSRFRRKAQLFPKIYGEASKIGPVRSVREFDEKITSPFSCFTGADDYYFRASAARVTGQIAIPALVLHALDDPFIRMMADTRSALLGNRWVTLVETDHGGHCAFLASKAGVKRSVIEQVNERPWARQWAEATLVRYLMATVGHADGS
jgi:predicted alpha/beta-fold hydrolase